MFHSPIQTNKAQITFLEQFCQIINFYQIDIIFEIWFKVWLYLLELAITLQLKAKLLFDITTLFGINHWHYLKCILQLYVLMSEPSKAKILKGVLGSFWKFICYFGLSEYKTLNALETAWCMMVAWFSSGK